MDDSSQFEEPAKENDPAPFLKWQETYNIPFSSAEALNRFKEMARAENGKFDDDYPYLRAQNPNQENARRIRVQFDLTEPNGDHDHCLFKSDEDRAGRNHAGHRRPQDYQVDRAATIGFIPETLLEPNLVFTEKAQPWRYHYICRTGSAAYFVVIVHKREKGEPRYRFVTAFPCSAEDFARRRGKLKISLQRK
jgi:hypothetical protein